MLGYFAKKENYILLKMHMSHRGMVKRKKGEARTLHQAEFMVDVDTYMYYDNICALSFSYIIILFENYSG